MSIASYDRPAMSFSEPNTVDISRNLRARRSIRTWAGVILIVGMIQAVELIHAAGGPEEWKKSRNVGFVGNGSTHGPRWHSGEARRQMGCGYSYCYRGLRINFYFRLALCSANKFTKSKSGGWHCDDSSRFNMARLAAHIRRPPVSRFGGQKCIVPRVPARCPRHDCELQRVAQMEDCFYEEGLQNAVDASSRRHVAATGSNIVPYQRDQRCSVGYNYHIPAFPIWIASHYTKCCGSTERR